MKPPIIVEPGVLSIEQRQLLEEHYDVIEGQRIGPGLLQDFILFPPVSLRDWFAGMALQGLVTNGKIPSSHRMVSEVAYQYADAMLAERSKHDDAPTNIS